MESAAQTLEAPPSPSSPPSLAPMLLEPNFSCSRAAGCGNTTLEHEKMWVEWFGAQLSDQLLTLLTPEV